MSDINVTPWFVLAGEATFTVSNGSGKHYTYHIYRAEPTAQYPGPTWFIKVLTSPDHYSYMGMLSCKAQTLLGVAHPIPVVKLTGRSKFDKNSVLVRVAQWALRAIWQAAHRGYQLPAGMSIKHEGKCGRCGRALTHPASLDTGIGPECANQLGVEWAEREKRQPPLNFDDPNTRRTKQNPGPERRKGPRTLHTIDEHTSSRDFELARHDLVSFFTKRL